MFAAGGELNINRPVLQNINPVVRRLVMESAIAKSIHLAYHPVALLWSNEKPAGAMQFSEGNMTGYNRPRRILGCRR